MALIVPARPKLFIPPAPAIVRGALRDLERLERDERRLEFGPRSRLTGGGGLVRQGALRGKSAAASAPTLTYIGTTSVAESGGVYTFTNHAIGTASADRLVIVAASTRLTSSGASIDWTAMTIGGNAATRITAGNTVHNPTMIGYLVVAAGTTATIVTTLASPGSGGFEGAVTVWTLTGYTSSTPTASATDNTLTGVNLSASYTVSAGGVLVAVGSSLGSLSRTFSGATGTTRADMAVDTANAFDSIVTSGSGTLTCTFDAASFGSMCLASWR